MRKQATMKDLHKALDGSYVNMTIGAGNSRLDAGDFEVEFNENDPASIERAIEFAQQHRPSLLERLQQKLFS